MIYYHPARTSSEHEVNCYAIAKTAGITIRLVDQATFLAYTRHTLFYLESYGRDLPATSFRPRTRHSGWRLTAAQSQSLGNSLLVKKLVDEAVERLILCNVGPCSDRRSGRDRAVDGGRRLRS